VGYPFTDNTWEPLENLDNCSFIVNEFLVGYGTDELHKRAEASITPQDPRPTVQDTFSSANILAEQKAALARSSLSSISRSSSPAHRSSRSISRSRRARNASSSPHREGIEVIFIGIWKLKEVILYSMANTQVFLLCIT
jgi:hypothetical protein